MSGVGIEQIQEQMRRLKLVRTAEELPLLLQDASKHEASYTDFLAELVSRELAAKQERHTAMKTTMARFPFQKSLESFDFKFQPSLEPKVIRELATGRFIADADNVLLLGPPGVGKTHCETQPTVNPGPAGVEVSGWSRRREHDSKTHWHLLRVGCLG